MKAFITIILVLFSSTAFAFEYKCDAQFIAEDNQGEYVVIDGLVVLKEENGKRTMDVTVDGMVLAENEKADRGVLDRPFLDMIEQIAQMKSESPEFAAIADQIYGDKIEKTLRGATRTTFYGFENDITGASLGFHYNRAGEILSAEISVAWLGTGLCK